MCNNVRAEPISNANDATTTTKKRHFYELPIIINIERKMQKNKTNDDGNDDDGEHVISLHTCIRRVNSPIA